MWTAWRIGVERLLLETWQLSSVWRSSLLREASLNWFSTVLLTHARYVLRSGRWGGEIIR